MRSSRILVTCIASLVPALGVSVAHAQTSDSTRSGDSSSSSAGHDAGHEKLSSKEFVKRAAEANLAEIKVSELAQSKAQSADVKQFAQQMITDHTQAGAELSKIAQGKNLKVPDDTDMMHKASMKLLQAKSGESFDSSYMEQMDKDHQKVIALFQSAASSADVDPELKAFASKTLPKLQQHHHLVAQVEAKRPSSSASADSSSSKR
jgi:putative membrane protein